MSDLDHLLQTIVEKNAGFIPSDPNAGGAPMQPPQGDPAMMGAPAPMPPAGAPMPPMDPSMMGGMPPMDPAMMGGGMPPIDPAMLAAVLGGGPAGGGAPAPQGAFSPEQEAQLRSIVQEAVSAKGSSSPDDDQLEQRISKLESQLDQIEQMMNGAMMPPIGGGQELPPMEGADFEGGLPLDAMAQGGPSPEEMAALGGMGGGMEVMGSAKKASATLADLRKKIRSRRG